MAKLFANSRDPDQMLLSAASDLGLLCLPITLLGVSRLKWVNLFLILQFAQDFIFRNQRLEKWAQKQSSCHGNQQNFLSTKGQGHQFIMA